MPLVRRAALHRLAALATVLFAAAPARATGPSGATISIVPVAANERGAVLFKTFRELNPDGGHRLYRAEFGWLVASADGLWREAPHAVVDPEVMGEEAATAARGRLKAWLDGPLEWAAPPESVKGLLRDHGFAPPKERFDPAEGKGAVTWSAKDLCVVGRCRWPSPPQRTLEELESGPEEGAPVACSFFHSGVALFRNGHGGAREAGAKFTLAPNIVDLRDRFGPRDLGYELVSADGIVVVGPSEKARGALPARVRPDEILGDVKSPQAAGRLVRGKAFRDDAGISLAKDGSRRRTARCDEFLALVRLGYEAQTTSELDDAGRYLVRCGGLELLAQARPSRVTRVSDFSFGDRSLRELPPCVGGRHASQEAADAASRATGERASWADFDPRTGVREASGGTLVFGDDVFETRLSTLAWGDVDGDGLEDLLVSSATHSKEGTWRNHELYVLTRRPGERSLRVVRELPMRRTGGACDPNDKPWDPVPPLPTTSRPAPDPYPTPVDRWLVSWGDPWGYSPPDLPMPVRMRSAMLLQLAPDGTALEVGGTLIEPTAAPRPEPVLSDGDGYSVHAGRWTRSAGGSISIELEEIVSGKAVVLHPGPRPPMTLTVHGRHLVGSDGRAFEPLEGPVSWRSLVGELADASCGPLRARAKAFPFCRGKKPPPPLATDPR